MLHPPRRQRQQRGSSTNAGPSRLIPAGGAQKQQQRDLDVQQLVESLQVPLHAARQALEACYGDLNAAADSLLGVDAATPVVQQQAEQQQLRRRRCSSTRCSISRCSNSRCSSQEKKRLDRQGLAVEAGLQLRPPRCLPGHGGRLQQQPCPEQGRPLRRPPPWWQQEQHLHSQRAAF